MGQYGLHKRKEDAMYYPAPADVDRREVKHMLLRQVVLEGVLKRQFGIRVFEMEE